MRLNPNAHRPIPIRRSLTERRQHVVEGGLPREPALPNIPEVAGVLGITPNAVANAIEVLERSGYRPLHSRRAVPELSIAQ